MMVRPLLRYSGAQTQNVELIQVEMPQFDLAGQVVAAFVGSQQVGMVDGMIVS